jgi:hypothetical protein
MRLFQGATTKVCPLAQRGGATKKISHFLTSRSGRSVCKSSSALLVAYVPKGTQRSSRLKSNLHTLRSTGFGWNPALLWYSQNDEKYPQP